MADYRYVVHDVATNAALGEVPFGGVVYSESLYGVESFAGALDLGARSRGGARVGATWREMLRPGRSKVTILRDGQPQGSPRIVWGAAVEDGRSLRITAAGTWSYFVGELGPALVADKTYSASTDDQFAIVRDLIATAQIGAGNIGMLVASGDSGVKRDRVYNGYEEQKVGKLVDDLSRVIGGFDFGVTTDMSSGAPVATLRMWHPRRGQTWEQKGITFTLGQNLRAYRWSSGAPTTTQRAIGAGEGATMLRTAAADADLLAQGYPLLERSTSYKDVSAQSTLDSHAVADRLESNAAATVWSLDLVDPSDVSMPFGAWQVGDDCKIVIPVGVDNLYPDGVEVHARIASQQVVVNDDGGPENVTLTVGGLWDAG